MRGFALADTDIIELNEAFAVQAIAVFQDAGMDEFRINLDGEAIAAVAETSDKNQGGAWS